MGVPGNVVAVTIATVAYTLTTCQALLTKGFRYGVSFLTTVLGDGFSYSQNNSATSQMRKLRLRPCSRSHKGSVESPGLENKAVKLQNPGFQSSLTWG